MKSRRTSLLALALLGTFAVPAGAVPISIMVGDNDGYGLGIVDNGQAPFVGGIQTWTGPGFDGSGYDGRSVAEKLAVNGAQITDNYSALYPLDGPNDFTSANVLFPLAGLLLPGAAIVIDMGDFQTQRDFAPLSATINGTSILFSFDDGIFKTAVRSIPLSFQQVIAANNAGIVRLNINRNDSFDWVAFDYFQLNGNVVQPGDPELFVFDPVP